MNAPAWSHENVSEIKREIDGSQIASIDDETIEQIAAVSIELWWEEQDIDDEEPTEVENTRQWQGDPDIGDGGDIDDGGPGETEN